MESTSEKTTNEGENGNIEMSEIVKQQMGYAYEQNGIKVYSCKACNFQAKVTSNLRSHVESKHVHDRNYHCIQCGISKKTWQNLQVHMKKDHLQNKVLVSVSMIDESIEYKRKLVGDVKSQHLNDKCYEETNKLVSISTVKDEIEHESMEETEMSIDKTNVLMDNTGLENNSWDKVGTLDQKEHAENTETETMKDTSHIEKNNENKEFSEIVYQQIYLSFDQNGTRVQNCRLCNFHAQVISNLRSHVESKHMKDRSYQCTKCGERKKTWQRLKVHEKSGKCYFYESTQAGESNLTVKDVIEHYSSTDDNDKASVVDDNKTELNDGGLKEYTVETEGSEDETIVNICKFEIENKELSETVKKQMRSTCDQNGMRVYTCNYCKFEAKVTSNLRNHVESKHMNDRMYKCIQCGTAKKTWQTLQLHMKRGKCYFESQKEEEGAEYENNQLGKLVKQQMDFTHVLHGKNVFNCKICNFQTGVTSNLRTHVESKHIKDRMYQCIKCGEFKKTWRTLQVHRNTGKCLEKKQVAVANPTVKEEIENTGMYDTKQSLDETDESLDETKNSMNVTKQIIDETIKSMDKTKEGSLAERANLECNSENKEGVLDENTHGGHIEVFKEESTMDKSEIEKNNGNKELSEIVNQQIYFSFDQNGTMVHHCRSCHFQAQVISNIRSHVESKHIQDRSYQCAKCGENKKTWQTLQVHRRRNQCVNRPQVKVQKNRVEHENNQIRKLVKLQMDVSEDQNRIKDYTCKTCNFHARGTSNLKNHVEIKHLKDRKYKCIKCGLSKKTWRTLQVHVKTGECYAERSMKNTREAYKVDNIKTEINFVKAVLNEGAEVKKQEETSIVDVCETEIGNKKLCELVQKQTSSTIDQNGMKVYNCNICNFQAKVTSNLRNHVESKHIKDKMYKCIKCGEAKKTWQTLQLHMKKGKCCIKSQKEEEGIEYENSQLGKLVKQQMDVISVLHGMQVYSCKTCNFQAKVTSNLRSHVESKHIKDRMYQCIKCGTSKKTWQRLQVHRKKDHNCKESQYMMCNQLNKQLSILVKQQMGVALDENFGKVYTCKTCSFQAKVTSNLRSHVEAKHIKDRM